MNDAPLVLSLNLLLWVYLAHRFFSALAKRKVTDGASLQAWGVIFGCYLIAALTVDGVRTQLDSTFGGLLVSTLVRSLLMLASGCTAREIACHLKMKLRRVYWVTEKMRARFGVTTNEHLISRASAEGFAHFPG